MRVLPLLYEDQFIQNFFNVALVRSATSEETLYWNYLLRGGYNDSAGSLKFAAIEFGRTLFESAAYAARARASPREGMDDHLGHHRDPDRDDRLRGQQLGRSADRSRRR